MCQGRLVLLSCLVGVVIAFADQLSQDLEDLSKSVVITGVKCTVDSKNLTVTFQRSNFSLTHYSDNYKVSLLFSKDKCIGDADESILCDDKTICESNNMEDQICQGARCQCSGVINCNSDFLKEDTVTVVVNITRERVTTSTNATFRLVEHMVPGAPTLSVVELQARVVTLKMCLATVNRNLMNPSREVGKPFLFHLSVRTQTRTTISQNIQVLVPSQDAMACVQLSVPGLFPDTRYQVTSFCSSGGGDSDRQNIELETKVSVPSSPPGPGSVWFSVLDRWLIIMWEPLPAHQHGGSNLSYIVQLLGTGHQETTRNKTTAYPYLVFNNSLSQTRNRTVRIWTSNEMGASDNYTELDIPRTQDTRDLLVVVEYNQKMATLILFLNGTRNVNQVGLYVCQNYTLLSLSQDSKYPVCLEGLQIKIFEVYTSDDVIQFSINLTRPYTYIRDTEDRQTNFIVSKNPTDSPTHADGFGNWTGITETRITKPLTAALLPSGTVLQNSVSTSSLSRSPIELSPMNLSPVDHSSAHQVPVDLSPVERLPVNLSPVNPAGEGDQDSSPSYPKVYVSLWTSSTQSDRGLTPATCYYDQSNDHAEVVLNYVQRGQQFMLQWYQRCDPEPRQFQVDCVRIYSSRRNSCSGDLEYVMTDCRHVGQTTNEILMPSSAHFACLLPFANKSSEKLGKMTDPAVVNLVNSEDTSAAIVFSVVGVLLALALLVLLIVIFVYCKRRKEKARQVSGHLDTCKEQPSVQEMPAFSPQPQTPTRSSLLDQTSIAAASEDSGQGSECSAYPMHNLKPISGQTTSQQHDVAAVASRPTRNGANDEAFPQQRGGPSISSTPVQHEEDDVEGLEQQECRHEEAKHQNDVLQARGLRHRELESSESAGSYQTSSSALTSAIHGWEQAESCGQSPCTSVHAKDIHLNNTQTKPPYGSHTKDPGWTVDIQQHHFYKKTSPDGSISGPGKNDLHINQFWQKHFPDSSNSVVRYPAEDSDTATYCRQQLLNSSKSLAAQCPGGDSNSDKYILLQLSNSSSSGTEEEVADIYPDQRLQQFDQRRQYENTCSGTPEPHTNQCRLMVNSTHARDSPSTSEASTGDSDTDEKLLI